MNESRRDSRENSAPDHLHGFRERMACLADASRFRIMLSLAAEEQCVSHLASRVGLSQSCTTRHLQALSRRGLVQGSRRGRQVVFAVRLEAPEVQLLLGMFDPGRAEVSLRSEARRPVAVPVPPGDEVLDFPHSPASDLPEEQPATPPRMAREIEDYLL